MFSTKKINPPNGLEQLIEDAGYLILTAITNSSSEIYHLQYLGEAKRNAVSLIQFSQTRYSGCFDNAIHTFSNPHD